MNSKNRNSCRKLTWNDEQIYKTFIQENQPTCDFVHFFSFIAEDHMGYFVDKQLVAVISYHFKYEDVIFIHTLFVKDEFRRKSIAVKLLNRLFKYGKRHNAILFWLRVEEHNRAAMALYESVGFEVDIQYDPDEDGITVLDMAWKWG